MKKEIIEFIIVFSNGRSITLYCQTLLEAFCNATLDAIKGGFDTNIHHILYQRETVIHPKLTFE